MFILGIETSCDETAAAIVRDGTQVLSNVIASSKERHARYGGVFPEVAARCQLTCMIPAVRQALDEAQMMPSALDAIAVTKGPGLLTSLLVGTMTARTLASVWKKPLIGVHHTMGHLCSTFLEREDSVFPILTLSVSGGHTDLWLRESHTQQELLGSTKDDAAGEAFDKGATLLGLPYPGGPALSALSQNGNPHFMEFTRPLAGKDSLDFSFSGLKTALKYALRDRGGIEKLSEPEKKDIAASYQHAICQHLVSRVERALNLHQVEELHLVGGVSANAYLRSLCEKLSIPLRLPVRMEYCTDNAAMIAGAAAFVQDDSAFTVQASLSL